MKAFAFPLEKVLAFRKRQWEAEAAILESLLTNRAHLEAQILRIGNAVDCARAQLGAGEVLEAEALAEFRLAQTSSREALRQLERILANLRNKIAEQQKAFLHARRNFELVVRLREKRYAEWQHEANREEETNATESYLARHTQRRLAVSSRPTAISPTSGETPLHAEAPAGAR